MEKNGSILFVEVKTRRSTDAVSPRELLSRQKQVHISRVAQYYLSKNKRGDCPAGFALLTIDWSGPNPCCELIEDAFPLAWGY